MSEYFQQGDVEIDYDFSNNHDERGAFYDIDMKKVTISGVEFPTWPLGFHVKYQDLINQELESEYGLARPLAI